MLLLQRLYRHEFHDNYALKLLLTTLIASTSHVNAIPLTFQAREDSGTSDIKLEIWLPIVLVVLLLAVVGFFFYRNRSLRQGASRLGRYALAGAAMTSGSGHAASNANTPQTRELTAEQLAGTAPGGTAGTTTAPAAANRTRRTRRPRRTPSQISTTSLPAYNKEPGEQELVVYRGPEDMEDVVILEGDGEDSLHSRNTSEASHYPPVPATPVDAPLLSPDAEEDHTPSQPPGDLPVRQAPTTGEPNSSSGTQNQSETTQAQSPSAPSASDPRGEAPAYSVIDLSDEPPVSGLPAQTSASSDHTRSASNESSNNGSINRRSGFRSLFGVLGGNSRPGVSPSNNRVSFSQHARNDSGTSLVSGGHGTPSRSRIGSHRASQSGSGSLLNLTQQLSRTRSNNTLSSSGHNNLNSPSMISLNSISAPLSHTLTRTEMTFPKSGPTPEQLAFISSRESLGRFGMPYGSEAIAFAASSSRADLLPPPEFEDVPRAGSSLSVNNRPGSGLGQVPRVDEEPSAPEDLSSDMSLPTADTTAADTSSSSLPPATSSPPVTSPPVTESTVVEDEDEKKESEVKDETSADAPKVEEIQPPVTSSESPTAMPSPATVVAPLGPNSTHANLPNLTEDKPAETAPPVQAEASSAPVPVVLERAATPVSDPSELAPAPVPATSLSSKAPPTAFKHPVTTPDFRPESRASSFRSMASFATAQQGYTDNETGASDYYSDDGNETETDGGDSRRNTLVLGAR